MKLLSNAFKNGEEIPEEYTGDGADISPPLRLVSVPPLAQSLVLIMDDPDAGSKPFVHWIIVNIPPMTVRLEAGMSALDIQRIGAMEITNSFDTHAYGGPCPPSGTHEYRFRLFALNTLLTLGSHARIQQVMDAMEDHVVLKTQLIGKYTKK
ncbi:YbhB/YbcL family Raf kinase inhibitor-like protein [Candidatus Neomarinimicrobiota bacterium]